MNLTFSIIIPSFNYGHILERAVLSVVCQTGSDYEVIIVDDGSVDNTADVANELTKRYVNKLSYFFKKNGGASSARNFGIARSVGRYLIFLDADDELTTNALTLFRRYVDTDQDYGLIIGSHTGREMNAGQTAVEKLHVASLPGNDRENCFRAYLDKKIAICNGAVAMQRSVFSQLQYSETLDHAEDIPVFALSFLIADAVAFPEPVVIIYKHPESRRKNPEKAMQAGLAVVDEIFDSPILSKNCRKYRKKYLTKRCLSLFRTLYRAKKYREARYFLVVAIRQGGWRFVSVKHWLRFMSSYLK